MCGIIGYVGNRTAEPLLIGGLEKLEYRGYDSAGIAVPMTSGGKSGIEVFRVEGKLSGLTKLLKEKGRMAHGVSTSGVRIGLGHTRWATHGRPSETNAHPHVAGKVCVVHNGIIENYLELRKRLKEGGAKFQSETDTEVAAHLLNYHFEKCGNLLQAMRLAVSELRGSYALVAMAESSPDRLVIAKNATPVIIGLAEGENFIASGIPAVLEHTRNFLVLEDGDIGEVQSDKVHIEHNGETVEREVLHVTWDPVTAEKGGYRHFMLKEIHEQPDVVTETFRGRINQEEGSIFLEGLNISDETLRGISRVVICACGTAWHAGLVTKFYIEKLAKIPVEVDYASEFRYRTPLINKSTLFIAISQSGETADTLGALTLAKEHGAETLAICNIIGSSIARKANHVVFTHAGPEISVASTKAFLTQLTTGYLLAIKLGLSRGVLKKEEAAQYIADLMHLPSLVTTALSFNKQIERLAKKYGKSNGFLFLGRGILYPVALEGALKLKEISYIHAEGYPAGEMKHGPIALINEELPVVIIFGHDGINYEKAMSNLQEVESRGGRIIAVTDKETPELKDVAWEVLAIGEMPPLLMPMVLTVPLQLLAYHTAIYRGTDVDQPRNLAKSVTVE